MVRRLHVSSGERLRIPADEYSSLLRAERLVSDGQAVFDAPGILDQLPPGMAWLKNNSGADVSEFGVLAIGEPIFDPSSSSTTTQRFKQQIAFNGETPSTSTPHYGKFGVLQEKCRGGKYGRAVVSGITQARLTIASTYDLAADIANGVTNYLGGQPHGAARILWKPAATGSQLCLVRVGDWVTTFFGKPADDILTATSGTVRWWAGAPGSEVDSAVDVTDCFNRTAVTAPADEFCKVYSVNGYLYVEPLGCS